MEIKQGTARLYDRIFDFDDVDSLNEFIYREACNGDYKVRKLPKRNVWRVYMGMVEVLEKGDEVHAVFRKYGKHEIIGTITNIEFDQHGLDGCWISIKVKEFTNKKDSLYKISKELVDKGWYNIMCPREDVWKDDGWKEE